MDCEKTFRDDGVLELICRGEFSNASFFTLFEQVISDYRWEPGTHVLVDFRNVDFDSMQFDDVIASVRLHTHFNDKIGNSKIAAIHSSENGLRLGKIYAEMSTLSVNSRIKTFLSYDDAVAWIHQG